MSNKNVLNEEELEKVTGGCAGTDGIDTKGQFTGFMNMYALHDSKCFNKEYYFVSKEIIGFCWFKAKLINSYEAWNFIGSNCTHDIVVTDPGAATAHYYGKKLEIYGDIYAVYTTKNF